MKIGRNAPLLIGICIPIAMVVFVAAAIYLPGVFAKPPEFDFVYENASDSYYECRWVYRVTNHALTKVRQPVDPTLSVRDTKLPPCERTLYLHDVTKNVSRQISFEEAEGLRLDEGPKSPDGYEVVQHSGGGDFPFLFDGGRSNGIYIRGHNRSEKADVISTSQPYYYNFRFLGWVLP